MSRVWVLVAFLVSGCVEEDIRQSGSLRRGESGHVNSIWIGRSYSDLVAHFGVPEGGIDTTLLGGPASIGYVYRSRRGDNCLDAFVVLKDTQEIIDYFCR